MTTPNLSGPNWKVAIWLMMHSASLGIVLSIYLFAAAAYDEHRGIAFVAPPAGMSGHPVSATRAENPEVFHNLMVYQWVRASLVLLGALVIRGFCRRVDRADPFSPHFSGNHALDECERTLDAELEKKHRPQR